MIGYDDFDWSISDLVDCDWFITQGDIDEALLLGDDEEDDDEKRSW